MVSTVPSGEQDGCWSSVLLEPMTKLSLKKFVREMWYGVGNGSLKGKWGGDDGDGEDEEEG